MKDLDYEPIYSTKQYDTITEPRPFKLISITAPAYKNWIYRLFMGAGK